MRKLLIIVILLLGSLTSVSAIGEVELSALARFVPDNALVYAGIRTDDDFLASLDALVSKGLLFFPSNQVPSELSILEEMDNQLTALGLGTFNEAIRPWLGNTAAAAIFAPANSFDDPSLLIAIEADGAGAELFFEPFLEQGIQEGTIEYSQMGDLAVYATKDGTNPVWIAFGEEAIFITNVETLLPDGNANPALSDSESFNSLLNGLPAPSYNIIAYVNNSELQAYSMAQAGTSLPPFFADMLNVNAGIALGFTMLNDEALVMDMVQAVDYSAFADYGLNLLVPSALDMNFSNRIPADAFAVLQSSDFGPSVQASFDNVRAIGEYIKASGGLADLLDPEGNEFRTETERNALNQVDVAWILGAMNLSFAGGTGLSLENDVLPAFDGDVAAYLRVLPTPNFMIPVLPDGAILFQSSDSASAQAIVTQLGEAATAYDQEVKTEPYGNGSAIVFSSENTVGVSYPSLDLLIGASDDLVAMGTREGVTASLDMNAGLAENAQFQSAMQYILPDSQSMAYLATEPVFNVLDPLVTDGIIPLDSDMEDAYRLISIVQSATVSIVIQNDGTSMARFVITLNPEPRPLPPAPDA